MAPLSGYLAGVILRHNKYGSHIDGSGKTIDLEFEKRNFFAPMKVVSGIWSENVIGKSFFKLKILSIDGAFMFCILIIVK